MTSRRCARALALHRPQKGTTSATVNSNSNGGVLSASLGLDNVDCNNAVNRNYVATSETVTFDVTQATGRTLVTMKVAAASVTKLWFKYEVCFSSPNSTFVNKYGATIPAGQAGILFVVPLRLRTAERRALRGCSSGSICTGTCTCCSAFRRAIRAAGSRALPAGFRRPAPDRLEVEGVQICPNCDEENPGRFRLCGFCGAALGRGAAPRPARRSARR